MSKRKSLSKKMRFEVFKRDSFKCQYCGKSSPDVTLEVDHIKPVSEGGTNDITNLITACFDCNRGKKDILLDDNSVLEKQRRQLEEINERRLQLEMMMNWREELISLDEEKIGIFKDHWSDSTGYSANDKGTRDIKKWIKKFSLNLLLECIDISVEQYLEYDKSGDATKDSVEKAFQFIPRIAANKLKGEEPYMKDLYYIRGILKNRLSYMDPVKAIKYLELAHVEADRSIESLKEFAKEVKNWTEFKNDLEWLFEDEDIDY
ncbi:HNH endonuclease [Virgibacillus dakarensis]|nr:HNH endonuclease [Virgibacillus dakarensis]MBT2215940.1 HNH endonuclease [Virgibacillus dakarensis]